MEAAAILQASTSHEEATEAVKPVALQRDVPHILWSRDCGETRRRMALRCASAPARIPTWRAAPATSPVCGPSRRRGWFSSPFCQRRTLRNALRWAGLARN